MVTKRDGLILPSQSMSSTSQSRQFPFHEIRSHRMMVIEDRGLLTESRTLRNTKHVRFQTAFQTKYHWKPRKTLGSGRTLLSVMAKFRERSGSVFRLLDVARLTDAATRRRLSGREVRPVDV